jgi:hypothetical protein
MVSVVITDFVQYVLLSIATILVSSAPRSQRHCRHKFLKHGYNLTGHGSRRRHTGLACRYRWVSDTAVPRVGPLIAAGSIMAAWQALVWEGR